MAQAQAQAAARTAAPARAVARALGPAQAQNQVPAVVLAAVESEGLPATGLGCWAVVEMETHPLGVRCFRASNSRSLRSVDQALSNLYLRT